jgi:prolyl-tRNA editing enzyme YbaK/EbsC (Cys-tRNA(Pro) deacylase)
MRSSVDVHNHLVERDIKHEVFNLKGRLRTAEQIASVLDLPREHVGKVVILETDKGPVAALVAAGQTPDLELVKQALSVSDVKPAPPPRASELSDYLAESIPPVGLPSGLAVLIDEPLAKQEVLYFHGGEASAVLKVRGDDLARAADAIVAPIS